MGVMLHATVLGLPYSPAALETTHPRIGCIVVAAWTFSLFLGIVTYVMFTHVHSWEPIRRATPVLPASARGIPST